MATFIKLTDAGSFIVRQIEAVRLDTNGNYPDLHLIASEGEEIIVIPKNAADRQLERLKLANEQALVGAWVKVSRSETPGKNGKLFWNLNVEPPQKNGNSERIASPYQKQENPQFGGKAGKVHTPHTNNEPPSFDDVPPPEDPDPVLDPKPSSPPTSAAPGGDAPKALKAATMRDQFLALWEQVATVQVATAKRMGFTVDGASVNAATATLWISLKDRGLI